MTSRKDHRPSGTVERAGESDQDGRTGIGRMSRWATGAALAGALTALPATTGCKASVQVDPTHASASTSGGDTKKDTVFVPYKEWRFVEGGLRGDVSLPLAKPEEMSGVHSKEITATAAYGMSYKRGLGTIAPGVGLGGYNFVGQENGEDISETALTLTPSVYNSNHVARRWALVERLGMPLALTSLPLPGAQIDAGISYVIDPKYRNIAVEGGLSFAVRPIPRGYEGPIDYTGMLGIYAQVIFDAVSAYSTEESQ